MENKITSIWNKTKSAKETFVKIALTKELNELVKQYKNELITKFQRVMRKMSNIVENLIRRYMESKV